MTDVTRDNTINNNEPTPVSLPEFHPSVFSIEYIDEEVKRAKEAKKELQEMDGPTPISLHLPEFDPSVFNLVVKDEEDDHEIVHDKDFYFEKLRETLDDVKGELVSLMDKYMKIAEEDLAEAMDEEEYEEGEDNPPERFISIAQECMTEFFGVEEIFEKMKKVVEKDNKRRPQPKINYQELFN